MGRLIDADKVRNEYIHAITLDMDAADLLDMLCNIIDNAPTVEAIPKDQYENRLKADMVAMLTDIQLEFEEGLRCKGCCNNCVNACEDIPAGWFLDFIDAKINSLKENTDGTTCD